MKSLISLTIIALLAFAANSQTKATTAADFKGTFQYAVSETNAAFPFIFTVVTKTYENGKLVSTETEVNERQAQGIERETKTLTKNGQTLRSYSVMVGIGNHTYCSKDGTTWRGPQQYVCPGPDDSTMLRLYGERRAESVEYTVTDKSLDGQRVKVYREYSVFASSKAGGKKTFIEKIATIDARGFFISVEDTEGSLDPKTITLTRTQTWDFKTKFDPVVAPK